MITDEITKELFRLRDEQYRDFQCRLIPTVEPSSVIGVRTPELRRIAKAYSKHDDVQLFLDELPHRYFDENQLHAFVLSEMKDYGRCLSAVERFLPFVDNWATCDQLSPRVFRKHKTELVEVIRRWLQRTETYTLRFAVGMLMEHFLDGDFDGAYPEMAAAVSSEEYYVRMMTAWYFATGLAKQYEAILPYLEQRRLDPWTHNKTIQKAVESNRITPERKEYLRSLRIK